MPMNRSPVRRALNLLAAWSFLSTAAHAQLVLSGGGLALVEEGGTLAPGNLAATGTAFAKDVLPGFAGTHEIAHLNDQLFGNGKSWIGNTSGTFAGVSFGATPVPISSIAFGRDNPGQFGDRTLGLYTLQYTTEPNPTDATTAWTTIGTLDYGAAGGTNYAFPSKRHRYTFNPVSATGIRLLVPEGGLVGGTCIDELEVYLGNLVIVTSPADTGSGSLREAIAAAAIASGPDTITFAPGLSGQTITLGSEIVINDAGPVAIDASSLPAGITLSGGNATRLFTTSAGSSLTLTGLTLTGGFGTGTTAPGAGGAILNLGNLTLSRCTLHGNVSASTGGAISNLSSGGTATLTATNCTLTANTSAIGGAIWNGAGSVTTLRHATIAGNDGTSDAGGILAGGTESLVACIVSANSGSSGGDNISGTAETVTDSLIDGSPLLGPLALNGGPVMTVALLAGSPALDLVTTPLAGVDTDQRGLPRNREGNGTGPSQPDAGALEMQTQPAAGAEGILITTAADENDPAGILGSGLSLREAVRLANAGTILTFDAALGGQPVILSTALGGEIVLDKNLTLDASNLPNGITIDGGPGTNRIFSIPAGQVVSLKRLTLTGGNGVGATASGDGGAIFNASSSLSLTHCTFQGNRASEGGGVFNSSASPTLTHCTFQGNNASRGGGICNDNSSPALTQCTFQENSASEGGGIGNLFCSPTLTDCSFKGNNATMGGGISNVGSSPALANCSFQGNEAGDGGGIRNYGSSPTLTNCSSQGNSAFRGGGIYNEFSSPTLNNCIIWRNKDNTGTGTANSSVFNASSTPTYSHCIIQGLNPGGTGNLDGTLSATDPLFVLEVNPDFAPTTGGDLRLLAGSPAIDAGDNASNPTTTDLGGRPRKVGTIDLGAYELQPLFVNVAVSGGTQDGSSWANAFPQLQSALAAAQAGNVIWVATGTYYPDDGIPVPVDPRASTFALKAGVALYGGFAGTETLLSQRNPAAHPTTLSGDLLQNDGPNFANNADNAYHVLTATGATITATTLLDGFTITAGNADGTIFPNNSGGGLFCSASAAPTLAGCSFQGNSASNGAGISNESSSPTLTRCSFQGNRANNNGGGIRNVSSSPTVTHCSFQGNNAAFGGGIYNFNSSSPTVTHCSFQGNSAIFVGGGIYNISSSPTLTNCILWRNRDASGSGTAASSVSDNNSTPAYSHCLIQGYSKATLDNGVTTRNNLEPNNPLFVREVDPNLAPTTTGGDLRLLTGSPALDAGNNAANTSSTDLAGNPRVQGGTIDLGAYEGNVDATFALLHPGLDPDEDANGNGIPNFGDYAAGGNPSAPDDPTLRPQLAGNQLTFSFRNNAADLTREFQKSATLLPGSWQQLIETTDYTVTTTSSANGRSLQTLTLTNALRSTHPKLFFRAAFESVP